MAVTKSYKVYGVDGHRQRESSTIHINMIFRKVTRSVLSKWRTATEPAQMTILLCI